MFVYLQTHLLMQAIGRSENKPMTKYSLYENEVRPGVAMIDVSFYYLQ